MIAKRATFALLIAHAAVSTTCGESVLWTTGPARTVHFYDGIFPVSLGFGYLSGYFDSTLPQRWAAVPFRLDEPSRITQIDAYYSNPNSFATTVNFRVWNRTDLTAPTSLAASGSLGSYVSVANVETADRFPWQHLHQHDVDFVLPAGDYYFTIHATGSAWLAWWTGGGLQDSALESNFLWRSAAFPSPGFQPWYYTSPTNELVDPRDVYNLAFSLRGTAAIPGDFNIDGAVDGGDLADWKRDFGVNGASDADGDGDTDGADFLSWQRNLGATFPAASAATHVPEPTSAVLVAAILLACRRTAANQTIPS